MASCAGWIILGRLKQNTIKSVKSPFILFCLALILSWIFSKDRGASLTELYNYAIALLLFSIANSFSGRERKTAVNSISIAAVIISLLAIYQYFFGFRHILDYLARKNITDPFIVDYVSRKRVFFPFITPNILGGYLAMIIPLSLVEKRKSWMAIPLFTALLLTRSLGALASLFMGLVVYFKLRNKLNAKRIFLLSLLAAAICVIFIIRSDGVKQHIQPQFSTIARLNYWKEAWNIIKSNPITGIGPGNFNLANSRYAHNSYLQLWAESGTLALLPFLWLVFVCLKQGIGKCRDDLFTCGLVASTTVFLIHNAVDFSFFLPEVSLLWWAILGMSLGLRNNRIENLGKS
ncbi:MAG: O-antigen ligase family protein [Candidatus Omnitrophica bacterium]|nr:O-antigen ligase family protein [Candidatus Omnitrophota bacterium]